MDQTRPQAAGAQEVAYKRAGGRPIGPNGAAYTDSRSLFAHCWPAPPTSALYMSGLAEEGGGRQQREFKIRRANWPARRAASPVRAPAAANGDDELNVPALPFLRPRRRPAGQSGRHNATAECDRRPNSRRRMHLQRARTFPVGIVPLTLSDLSVGAG